jgi:hypothetical protein
MTCGIYQLTFSDGSSYIGKSINIEERWNQHLQSMIKGTASKLMQAAYSKYGQPKTQITFVCHPHHIDLVEAHYIAKWNPTLNYSRPPDPFAGIEDPSHILLELTTSTLDHIHTIFDLNKKYTGSEQLLKEARNEIAHLVAARSEETIKADIKHEIFAAKIREADLRSEIKRIRDLLIQSQKPWWRKIF